MNLGRWRHVRHNQRLRRRIVQAKRLETARNSRCCRLIGRNHGTTVNMVTEIVKRGSITAAA
jgi:hypothetical protein